MKTSQTEKFKDSRDKKVMIIGIVPDIQENYINVKQLWLETVINSVTRKFTIATDKTLKYTVRVDATALLTCVAGVTSIKTI